MKIIVCVFICSLAATVFAVLLHVLVPRIVKSEIKKNLYIKNDSSERYRQWKYPTIPMAIKLFVFDIVNAQDIYKGMKPVLKQKGPYTYKEFINKTNIHFNDSRPAVTFDQKKWYIFDESQSCTNCNPYNDTVTTINAPYVIIANVAESYNAFVKFVMNVMLKSNKEGLIMTRTVNELLWGYNDPLFEQFARLRKKYGFTFIPQIDPYMTYEHNNSYDGIVIANTGEKDIEKTGVWESWRGHDNVTIWKTKYANMFNGSDGTQFPPGVTRDETLYFFSPNLCRSMYIKYLSKNSIKDIDVLRFTTPEELFLNSSQIPDNAAFCQQKCNYPNGILSGTNNCQPSQTESPIVISTPHFLYGDSTIRDRVKGLSPNMEKHGIFFSIEPITGVPLNVLIRLQLNLHVREIPGIFGTEGVKEAYIPVFYFSNEAAVDDSTAAMLRNDIFLPLQICNIAEICLFSLGGLLLIVSALLAYRKIASNYKSKNYSLPPQNVNNTSTEKSPLLTKDV